MERFHSFAVTNKSIVFYTYLGYIIKDYFGNGSRFGVSISYIIEDEPLGTAGSLFYLKDWINDDFLLINGDIIFDIDINRFVKYHKTHGGTATLFTHPNDHPYDSGVIFVDDNMHVIKWLHKEDTRKWYKNRVNAGLHIISPQLLNDFSKLQKRDLDREVLRPLIDKHE